MTNEVEEKCMLTSEGIDSHCWVNGGWERSGDTDCRVNGGWERSGDTDCPGQWWVGAKWRH